MSAAYTPPPETQWNAATLSARIAELRRVHDSRTEAEALELTRHAIERWSKPPRLRIVLPPHRPRRNAARRVRHG